MKRKLCVSIALIGESRVILLDEPTAGMDPEARRDICSILKKFKKNRLKFFKYFVFTNVSFLNIILNINF